MNSLRHHRAAAVLAVVLALAACGAPAPKPAAPPAEAAVPRLGVVGLVSETKERGMNRDNWKGAIGGLFSNETESGVMSTRYEVTVFYDDSTTGTVVVDQNPNLTPGQRVRVTGNKIEPVRR